MAGAGSVIEAITILMISIAVFYMLEITFGTAMDTMAYHFSIAAGSIPGADPRIIGPILDKFGYMHRVMGIFVVAMVIWCIRIVIFEHSYTRSRY